MRTGWWMGLGLWAITSFGAAPGPGHGALVLKDGRVVSRELVGPGITERTNFQLASVSKQFTALAAAMLMEEGKLGYDDPIDRHLAGLPPETGAVRVSHLIHHTGGLPEYFDICRPGAVYTNADVLAFARRSVPGFRPGSRYEYSNTGYALLASVIEAASGVSYPEFLRRRIFEPLGMTTTVVLHHPEPFIPERAADEEHPCNPIYGDGGVYSDLGDLARWAQGWETHPLVSRGMLKRIFTGPYGFGWRIDTFEGLERRSHGGHWLRFHTHIAQLPDRRTWVVVLSNRAGFDAGGLADRLLKSVLP